MRGILTCITVFRDRDAATRLVRLVRDQTLSSEVVAFDNSVPPLGDLGIPTVARGRNGGTAASLAWAVREADRRGHGLVWMLDQDAEPHPECLAILRNALEGCGKKGSPAGAGAAAPRAYDVRRGAVVRPARWTAHGFEPVDSDDFRGVVSGSILSGLLVDVGTARNLDFPKTSLFLDWVDYAFCAELERAGRPCLSVPEARLGHTLGSALIRRTWRGRDVLTADYPAWRVAASHRNRIWVEASIARRRGTALREIARARARDALNGAHFLAGSGVPHATVKATAALAGFASGLARALLGVSCYASARDEAGTP